MGSLTDSNPKPLIEINNRPLIDYMLAFTKSFGAEKRIVVGGYRAAQMQAAVARLDPGADFVVADAEGCQNAVSLQAAVPLVQEGADVVVCNADYIFSEHTARAVKQRPAGLAIYCSAATEAEDDVMKVQTNERGTMQAMDKGLAQFNWIYTGIWSADAATWSAIAELAREQAGSDPQGATVEHIIRAAAAQDIPVHVADVGPADWFEFDTPDDLAHARSVLET